MELNEVITKLKQGDKEDIRTAKQYLARNWPWRKGNKQKRDKYIRTFAVELDNFHSIKGTRNKVAFISSLKHFFMSAVEDEDLYREVVDFVLAVMKHKSGHVRRAMSHAAVYLIISLDLDEVDFPGRDPDKKKIERDRRLFCEFVDRAQKMSAEYFEPRFNRYKYVTSLPTGIYKSLQMLLSELLRADFYQQIYADYKQKEKAAKNPRRVLPQIEFKYLKKNDKKNIAGRKGVKCANCGKKDIDVGSTGRDDEGRENFFCEPCSIRLYKQEYGYATLKAAAARRRRIFDVPYLFGEMVIDEYIKHNKIKDVAEIGAEEMNNIMETARQSYNELFSQPEKILLEEVAEQAEIEKHLRLRIKQVKVKRRKKAPEPEPIPKWMDCTWKRVPCGREKCPICGRLKKTAEKGGGMDDPESLEAAMEDMSNAFRETLSLIKQDAADKGFDISNVDDIKEPPVPQAFPLYNRVSGWRNDLLALAESSDELSSAWLFTEAGEDLLWYANTLAAKTYRQFCNRWHLENNDGYGDFDHEYTGYVLSECLKFLNNALTELIEMDVSNKNSFITAQVWLTGMEGEILDI